MFRKIFYLPGLNWFLISCFPRFFDFPGDFCGFLMKSTCSVKSASTRVTRHDQAFCYPAVRLLRIANSNINHCEERIINMLLVYFTFLLVDICNAATPTTSVGSELSKQLRGSATNLLHAVAEPGELDRVVQAQHQDGDINHTDVNGRTAFHLPSQNRHAGIVDSRNSSGFSVNEQDSLGYTPLHFATINKNEMRANQLIHAGADINMANISKHPPLHYAILLGNRQMINLLIFRGSKLFLKNISGQTALHLAVIMDDLRTCKHILRTAITSGGDFKKIVHARSNNNETAFDLAIRLGHGGAASLIYAANEQMKKKTLQKKKRGKTVTFENNTSRKKAKVNHQNLSMLADVSLVVGST